MNHDAMEPAPYEGAERALHADGGPTKETDAPRSRRGYIIPIGGAENKGDEAVILKRFIELAGGAEGRIVVIPTASRLEDRGARYARLFKDMGASDVSIVTLRERGDCEQPVGLEEINHATGLFLTGGNQLRLATTLGGTPAAERIRKLNAEGVHVAGTSAGGAFLSEHMIAGGKSGATPTASGVRLAPGLGLTNTLIIDQHFRQRDRLGRLLAALAYNPYQIGVGLDEDTAIFIQPDNTFEVVGTGAVTVVDPSHLKHSTMGTVHPSAPVSLIGLQLHILAEGARFDVHTREATLH